SGSGNLRRTERKSKSLSDARRAPYSPRRTENGHKQWEHNLHVAVRLSGAGQWRGRISEGHEVLADEQPNQREHLLALGEPVQDWILKHVHAAVQHAE